MIKLKWAQNNKLPKGPSSANRNWIHAPDALQRGHMAYLVKFLGNTEVEQPKGIDVVKEGIRKLKFNQQLKRAEGTKTPKVELTISVDGVAIQEPKTKKILHQYPLHRISYCADDKADKKFFSFIAKEADSDKHTCFVFVSDKLAEEITLTIGQAFDLAYRRFLETSGRDLEIRKQMVLLQKKVQTLEAENLTLKQRIAGLELLKDRHDVDNYKRENDILDLQIVNGGDVTPTNNNQKSLLKEVVLTPGLINPPPPVPPRSHEKKENTLELLSDLSIPNPSVGRRLENLVMDEMEDFDPRGSTVVSPQSNGINNNNVHNNNIPTLCPPPPANGVRSSHDQKSNGKDLFGAEPFVPSSAKPGSTDVFGMEEFVKPSSNDEPKELDSILLDKSFTEMLDGFSRGLSFGNDDFSLESLDPLHKSS